MGYDRILDSFVAIVTDWQNAKGAMAMDTAVAVTATSGVALPPRAALVTAGQNALVGQTGTPVTGSVGGSPTPAGAVFAPVDRSAAGSPVSDKMTDVKANTEKSGSTGSGAAGLTVNPTFQYDSQSHQMVMITRDRESGAVVTQIPSQMALRQYDQAVKRVRDDVTAAALSGSAPSGISSLTAASLGIVIPFGLGSGSSTAGVGLGRTGGARYSVVV